MATSVQIDGFLDDERKRNTTICKQPEKIIDINDKWKVKGRNPMNDSSSFERIFQPGSPTREKSDGDVTQIKIERALKLRDEDTKGK